MSIIKKFIKKLRKDEQPSEEKTETRGKTSPSPSNEHASDNEQQEPKEQPTAKKVKNFGNKVFTKTGKLSAPLFVFLAQDKLLSYLGQLTKSPATIYDKALDAEYLRTYIGGGDHRLFDGGHDVFAAWEKVKDASPDDSFRQEVIGYTSALWKDVTTVKGLPFTTVDKGKFEACVKALDWIPGVDRKYLYELLSFDVMEIFSATLGAVVMLFALKKKDHKVLAEILGSMGINSIISANPIMGILVICTAGYAYKKKQMKFDKVAFGKSAVMSVVCTALFGVLGLPLLFKFILITVITTLFRTQVLDNEQLHAFIKEDIVDKAKEKNEEISDSLKDMIKNFPKEHLRAFPKEDISDKNEEDKEACEPSKEEDEDPPQAV